MPYITNRIATEKKLAPHGISITHAEVFLKVANDFDCIIMLRSPGPYILGLVAENYSTKGYHNKAKSCNWGPMAGFVLEDPCLSKLSLKTGGQMEQANKIRAALRSGCSTTPLIISETRVNELIQHNVITVMDNTNPLQIICQATLNKYGANTPVAGNARLINNAKKYKFLLEETYDRNRTPNDIKYYSLKYGNPDPRTPVNAIVDQGHRVKIKGKSRFPAKHFDMATIGDYDLFAVWQRLPRARYLRELKNPNASNDLQQMHTDNLRPVSAMNALHGDKLDDEYQDSGNSKDIIRLKVRPALNRGFRTAGYLGGDLIQHSDEAGRPQISQVDFPVLAFLPEYAFGDRRTIVYLNNINDFLGFYLEAQNKFLIDLNQGWINQINKLVKKGHFSAQKNLVKSMATRPISG